MKLTIRELRDARNTLTALYDSGALDRNTYEATITQVGEAIDAEIEAVRVELLRSAV
jgi:hypothetical protein